MVGVERPVEEAREVEVEVEEEEAVAAEGGI
jgi:hypothetical protein